MTRSRWFHVWNDWPTQFAPTDYLRQVARTVAGQPISEEQCQRLVEDIDNRLGLASSDALLDLCCGNGLITARLATRCRRVVGVDFSEPLLAVANRDHRPANVVYRQASILDLDQEALAAFGMFDKILMYDALTHFTPAELERLLGNLLRVTAHDCRMLFGGVPYRPHRRRLYDTHGKALRAWWYRMTGRDLIGTWWEENDFVDVCRATGLQFECFRQPPELYNSRFRFDVVVFRVSGRTTLAG